jgi:ribose-phosphate pyrophosphokinase
VILYNGKPIKFERYPNGETRVPTPAIYAPPHRLILKYESDQDLIHLMFIKRYMEDAKVTLDIRYMPYSRMDRVEYRGVFTLKFICDFINDLNFAEVNVHEPHSDVTCALLDRSTAHYPTIALLPQVVKDIGWHAECDYLFFPDAGAQKRYASITGFKTAVGFKHRDFASGALTGEMEVVGFKPKAFPTKALIVDDLCSRGGTFVMASKALRAQGAHEVYLFVAHCEETMWSGELLEHIDGLYCTDSILADANHPKVHLHSEGKWL